VKIGKDYLVRMTGDRSAVEFRNQRGRQKLLWTAVRGEHTWFIYDRNYSGVKMEMNGNAIDVYRNQKLISRYSLREP
jgi:hypothetical protein